MGISRRSAVAALVFIMLAGCSTTPSDRAGSPGNNGRGGNGSTPGVTGPAGRSQGGASGGPGGTSGISPNPSQSQSVPDDYISAFANENANWGCRMRPGEFCAVPVTGAYFLKASNVGGIQIVAFENGSSTPAEESVVRPVPAGGSPYNAKFGYRIGAGAQTFTIQGYLKDDRGIVVAKSRPQTFRVNRS